MDPRDANLVSFSAANMDFDFERERNAKDDAAPILDNLDELSFGGLLLLDEYVLIWIVDMHGTKRV